jgi:uroporphyrinogen-III synthase
MTVLVIDMPNKAKRFASAQIRLGLPPVHCALIRRIHNAGRDFSGEMRDAHVDI